MDLEHQGHSILSWSVNPPEVSAAFEENVPSTDERIEAMRRVAERSYRVRAIMMPIIPVAGWQDIYARFTEHLLQAVPIERLTLGLHLHLPQRSRPDGEKDGTAQRCLAAHRSCFPTRGRREGPLCP